MQRDSSTIQRKAASHVAAAPEHDAAETTSAPVQLSTDGVGTTDLQALMSAGGNLGMVQMHGGGGTEHVHQAAAHGIQGSGGSIPHKETIQNAFGNHDVGGIQSHVGGAASEANSAMGAEAYATGTHVAFKETPSLHTAAHEAAHIVQQESGAVSLSGGVGQVGDKYEQHADAVADAVVSGKSAAPLLDSMTGGKSGGGGVQQRAVQREATAPTTDQSQAGGQQAELTADVDRDADGDAIDATTQAAIDNPASHPYAETFYRRVAELFASGRVGAPGRPVLDIAKDLWVGICRAMKAAQPDVNDPAAYSDWANKYVDMKTPEFERAMGQFAGVTTTIANLCSTQFMNSRSFGFWSKTEGRKLAEQLCDVTLETSGIGGLFDGLPTLDASAAGWDVDLWGGLSNAYAQAVADGVGTSNKRVHVCIGGGARKDNIWGIVESKALSKGLDGYDRTLQQVVTYHGAGAAEKADRTKLIPDKRGTGEFPGAVYSGGSWDDAQAAATAHYNGLPAAPTSGT